MTNDAVMSPAAGTDGTGSAGAQRDALYAAALAQASTHIAAGRWADALTAYQRAVALNPDGADAQCNLGAVLNEMGRPAEAEAPLRRAIALRPDYVQAYGNLGNALKALGRAEEAVAVYARALELAPRAALLHYNLGIAQAALGRHADALISYSRAIEGQPVLAAAHNNLGMAQLALGQPVAAEAAFRQAIQLAPGMASAVNNLGNALRQQDRLDDAIAVYGRAAALSPDYAEAHYNLGVALADRGRQAAGVAALRRALHLRPGYVEALGQLIWARRQVCDWDGLGGPDRLAALEEQAVALAAAGRGGGISPFTLLNMRAPSSVLARQGADYAARTLRGVTRLPSLPPRRRTRLRLGYLSCDFHQHATAYLMTGVIEAHDRRDFEVVAYAWGRPDASPVGRRIRAAFDRVVDIGPLAHADAARRIYDDGVDILIDLKGYTEGARPAVLAARPAPVQVSYLGYPGPLGVDHVDYVIADPVVLPFDRQADYHERIVHLPGCYQPNDDRRAIGPAGSRAEAGLPPRGFVFCCLNAPHKITGDFFDIWMRLLRAVPGSVLWLLDPLSGPGSGSGSGGEAEGGLRANLRAAARARGVAAERLVFAPSLPHAAHLGRHALADLFLDTLPYNAHTAASDALWAGLPVLTCRGDTFAGRVAASLLTVSGLPELIADDPAAYEAQALRLATTPDLLAALRARLVAGRASNPLFATGAYTAALETAYRRMWEIHLGGGPPMPLSI